MEQDVTESWPVAEEKKRLFNNLINFLIFASFQGHQTEEIERECVCVCVCVCVYVCVCVCDLLFLFELVQCYIYTNYLGRNTRT